VCPLRCDVEESTGLILPIAVGVAGVLSIVAIGAAVLWCRKNCSERFKQAKLKGANSSEGEETDTLHRDPTVRTLNKIAGTGIGRSYAYPTEQQYV